MQTAPAPKRVEQDAFHHLLDWSTRAQTRASQLATTADRLIAECAATRLAVIQARRLSSTRRLLRLGAGGAEPAPQAEPAGRAALRARIVRGDVRRDHCRHVIVSTGQGEACYGCTLLIDLEHVELRARSDDGALLRFHARCFSSWFNETQSS